MDATSLYINVKIGRKLTYGMEIRDFGKGFVGHI